MTFLLPYSMIARGWDRPFRGLARFDLITAMAIPFILVTSCIVIASAYAFHGRADEAMLSDDPAIVMQSRMFQGSVDELEQRRQLTAGEPELAVRPGDAREDDPGQPDDRLGQLATFVTQLSPQERQAGGYARQTRHPSTGGNPRPPVWQSTHRQPRVWSGSPCDGVFHDHYPDVD